MLHAAMQPLKPLFTPVSVAQTSPFDHTFAPQFWFANGPPPTPYNHFRPIEARPVLGVLF